MNQQTNSSDLKSKSLFFQTNTQWTIQLENNGQATHKLEIRVLNPERYHPISSLSFSLPPSGVYSDFSTHVGSRHLRPGYGYIQADKRYSISLEEVVRNSADITITISFKQELAFAKFADTSLVIWPFDVKFYGPVRMHIFLPKMSGWQRIATWITRKFDRKPLYYVIHELELPPMSITPTDVDIKEGKLVFVLQDGICTPGFAFERYSKIAITSVAIAVSGLVISFLIAILAISSDLLAWKQYLFP